jgi:hypothetical protein
MMFIGQGLGLNMKKILFFVICSVVFTLASYAQKSIGLNDLNRFEHIGNEVVFDKATQLTWKTCSTGQQIDKDFGCGKTIPTMNWAAAKKNEMANWRLPTRDELATLIERYGNENKSPTRIDVSVFYRANKGHLTYWTSDAAGAGEAWYVNFGLGPITGKADKNSQFAVRLVKGTFVPPAPEVKPPQDIYEFLGRRDDCNHFAGEIAGEPNSSARDRQIDKTMTEMRCNRIEADEKKLRKKYQAKPDMLKWLDTRPE